ncbi:MAG: hypothetical protein H3C43_05750 [Leptonema sp. (in: Bacteria)]|nr:hypothetical protein [Leptonema sp. (in: bacteria)]
MNKLQRLILFKHGVGYFERYLKVGGQAELDFRASEIDDVLKSIVIYDQDINNLSFDAKRPVSEELKEIGLTPVAGNQSLTELLIQLSGVQFLVTTESTQYRGALIGLENREEASSETNTMVSYLLIKDESDTIKPIRLSDVKQLLPDEERARRDLNRLIEAGLYWKQTDRKKLVIQSLIEKEIRLSYMLPVAVWKSSYRILLDNDSCLVQSWALVHNTSDEDWNEVKLSLASGLPISFRIDLYTPRYKNRPLAELSDQEEYSAPIMGQFFENENQPLPAPMPKLKSASRSASLKRVDDADYSVYEEDDQLVEAAFFEKTSGKSQSSDVADVSFFEIEKPVKISAGKSALVPLFTKNSNSKRVTLYRESIRSKNPMTAVLLKNSFGFGLEEGPITFYSSNGYVGEGMMPLIRDNEETIIPYSIELGIEISSTEKSKRYDVHQVIANNGTIYIKSKRVYSTIYMIRSKSKLNQNELYIDHQGRDGCTVVSQPPLSTSDGLLRFKLSTDTTEFEVQEEQELTDTIYINNDWNWLSRVLAINLIQSKERTLLQEIAAVVKEIYILETNKERSQERIEAIAEDQKRIRENLKVLSTTEEERSLRRRYIKELESGEDELNRLRKEIFSIDKSRIEKINSRDTLIGRLSFDFKVG